MGKRHKHWSLPLDGQTWRHFFALIFRNHVESFPQGWQFSDPHGGRPSFASYYRKHIWPLVRTYEHKRWEALRVFNVRGTVVMALSPFLVAGLVYLLFFSNFTFDMWKIWLSLMIGSAVTTGIGMWVYAPVAGYKRSIKSQIFPAVFRFFGDEFHYHAVPLTSVDQFMPSGLIPDYKKVYAEDHIQGMYQDVRIDIMEATLLVGNKKTMVGFEGVLILLSMNKNFSGQTIVFSEKKPLTFWVLERQARFNIVNLEDPVFEKQFKVYSDDQVEARYLLTTSFMQRLLDLQQVLGGKDIQASFYDNQLLLMVHSRHNRFECASIFTPSTFEQDIHEILAEMQSIFQIIEVLKLNQKTGL